MRKIVGLLSLLCISMIIHAQIKKGAILLGGQLSYNRTSTANTSIPPADQVNRYGTFSVSAGKAFKENSVFGLNISISPSNNYSYYATNNSIIITNSKLSQYSAGIFYRKYKKLAGDFYFFAEGGAAYTGFHQTNITTPGNSKVKSTESGGLLYLTPGLSYNIFKKLQAELLIPNIFSTRYTHSSSGQNMFSISTGLQNTNLGSLGIGFNFIL